MNHDYAHCGGNACSIREKCKRYLLHLEAVEKGMVYVPYMIPDRKGIECNFYWEEER